MTRAVQHRAPRAAQRTLRAEKQAADVLAAARERMALLYQRYDHVVVSFSGGKDSTVCLQLALEAAAASGRLPVHAYFWDEEAIHPETVAYMHRVAERPDVALRWLCLPHQHRNACSRRAPYWYPWDPDQRARWCRPLPARAESLDRPGWRDPIAPEPPARYRAIPEQSLQLYGPEHGTVAHVLGIRTQESLRRLRIVTRRRQDNWITNPQESEGAPWVTKTMPIYDWQTTDVWVAPRMLGWDYNRTYDLFRLAGVPPHSQRVCPPYGEEPLQNLYLYAVCWPELWHKMILRVPGAAAAARYSRTELYGFGEMQPPQGQTWQSWSQQLIALYPKDVRRDVAAAIARLIRWHQSETSGRPIPEDKADVATGLSWRYIAMLVHRGDLKGRRAAMVIAKAKPMSKEAARGYRPLTADEQAGDRDEGVRY